MATQYVKIERIDEGFSEPMTKAIKETVDFVNQLILKPPGPTVPVVFQKRDKEHFNTPTTIASCYGQHLKTGPTATEENAKKIDPQGLKHYGAYAPWPTYGVLTFSTLYERWWNYELEYYFNTLTDNFVRQIILHEILHITVDREVFLMNDLLEIDNLGNAWFVGQNAIKAHDDLYEDYPELQRQIRGKGIPMSEDGSHFAPHRNWFDGKICVPGVSLPAGSETPDPHPVMSPSPYFGTLDREYFTQLEEAIFLDLGFTINGGLVVRHKVDEQLISTECGCSEYKMVHGSRDHLQNKLYLEGELKVKIGTVHDTTIECNGKVTPKFMLSEIQRLGDAPKEDTPVVPVPEGSCCFCMDALLYRKSRRTGKLTQIIGRDDLDWNGYSYRYVPNGKLYDGSDSPFVFDPGQFTRDPIFVEFPERDKSYYYSEEGDELIFKYQIVPCGSPFIDFDDKYEKNQEGFGPLVPELRIELLPVYEPTKKDMIALMKMYGLEDSD
jgi:hypothetical protein